MVLLKVAQEPVVVAQIQYIAVCDGKTSSLDLLCVLKLWKFRKAQCNGRVVNECLCRDAETFSHHSKKKESLIASSREPCEEPDCMCSENCVVCL